MSPNPPTVPLADHEVVLAKLDALRDVFRELYARRSKEWVTHEERALWDKAFAELEGT